MDNQKYKDSLFNALMDKIDDLCCESKKDIRELAYKYKHFSEEMQKDNCESDDIFVDYDNSKMILVEATGYDGLGHYHGATPKNATFYGNADEQWSDIIEKYKRMKVAYYCNKSLCGPRPHLFRIKMTRVTEEMMESPIKFVRIKI